MPYVLGDVVKIDFYQDYLEQGIVNTLFYKVVEIITGAVTDAILDKLCETIVLILKDLQSSDLSHMGQVVYNITDGLSVYNSTYTNIGAVTTSENLASFVAVGMKKTVSTRATRPGSLRIAGIKESSIIDNGLTSGAAAAFTSAGVGLASDRTISDGGDSIKFRPVVVGRNTDGSYNLSKVNEVTSVGFPRLTSQNSRKFWRGT